MIAANWFVRIEPRWSRSRWFLGFTWIDSKILLARVLLACANKTGCLQGLAAMSLRFCLLRELRLLPLHCTNLSFFTEMKSVQFAWNILKRFDSSQLPVALTWLYINISNLLCPGTLAFALALNRVSAPACQDETRKNVSNKSRLNISRAPLSWLAVRLLLLLPYTSVGCLDSNTYIIYSSPEKVEKCFRLLYIYMYRYCSVWFQAKTNTFQSAESVAAAFHLLLGAHNKRFHFHSEAMIQCRLTGSSKLIIDKHALAWHNRDLSEASLEPVDKGFTMAYLSQSTHLNAS